VGKGFRIAAATFAGWPKFGNTVGARRHRGADTATDPSMCLSSFDHSNVGARRLMGVVRLAAHPTTERWHHRAKSPWLRSIAADSSEPVHRPAKLATVIGRIDAADSRLNPAISKGCRISDAAIDVAVQTGDDGDSPT